MTIWLQTQFECRSQRFRTRGPVDSPSDRNAEPIFRNFLRFLKKNLRFWSFENEILMQF